MKYIFINTVFLFLIGLLFFVSCKKEYSCEECREFNKLPVAVGGPDQIITLPNDSILLDGSASEDTDGTIVSFLWTKISGPSPLNIINPNKAKTAVKNLDAGVYLFELKITDDGGLSAKDTVMITADSVIIANHLPIANAGRDTIIILPNSIATLEGSASSDPDNDITGYVWTKISGPSSFHIANPNAIQTPVSNLVGGIYQFELKVTDAVGLFAKDTVQVLAVNKKTECTECKIVFVSNRDGNAEIYTYNVDGSNISRLTNNVAIDEQPAWSPDGTKIAFISDRTGHREVYIMNADGSNLIRKTYSESYSQNPAWSPDGTKILYATVSNGSMNIWVVGATNGSPTLMLEKPGWDSQPAWSPDGTKIAIVSDWAAYDFVYDIYTINSDGTGFTALTGNMFDGYDYLHPSWSPSGTKLAMAINQQIGIDQYKTQVGIMNQDGSGITAIISNAAPMTRTSWSGDGTRIAYTSLSGSGWDISWVSADGSSWGTIVTNGWNADWQH